MSIHIYAPSATKNEVALFFCSTCNCRRKMLLRHFEWHAPEWTCLTCGERWSDGERLPRPFCPGWRKDSVKRAKKILEATK